MQVDPQARAASANTRRMRTKIVVAFLFAGIMAGIATAVRWSTRADERALSGRWFGVANDPVHGNQMWLIERAADGSMQGESLIRYREHKPSDVVEPVPLTLFRGLCQLHPSLATPLAESTWSLYRDTYELRSRSLVGPNPLMRVVHFLRHGNSGVGDYSMSRTFAIVHRTPDEITYRHTISGMKFRERRVPADFVLPDEPPIEPVLLCAGGTTP